MNWLRPRQLTLPAPLPNQSGNLTVETDSLWAGVLQLYACHGQPLSWTFYPSPRGCNYKNDGRDQTQPLRIISPLGLCCLAAPALLDSTHQPLPAYNHIHSHSSAHLLLQLGKRGGGENQKKAASFCNLLVDLLLGGRSSMEDLLGLLRINIKRGYNLAVRDVYSSDPYVFVRMGKQVRPIIPRKPFWSFASNSSVSLSLSLSFISILFCSLCKIAVKETFKQRVGECFGVYSLGSASVFQLMFYLSPLLKMGSSINCTSLRRGRGRGGSSSF